MIDFAATYFWLYLQGAAVGLGLTIIAMFGSVGIGLVAALGRLSKYRIARGLSSAYVALFRGIPPLVLLYVVYFGLPTWAYQSNLSMLREALAPLDNRLFAATVAFAVNSGAYSTEIIRAGIVSIHPEQQEAAYSIGMSYWLAMRRIILPQAMRVAFPPLGNEFITTLKGTSLASVIGVTELMRSAQLAAAATFENLTSYTFAAFFYVALVIVLQTGITYFERRLSPGLKSGKG